MIRRGPDRGASAAIIIEERHTLGVYYADDMRTRNPAEIWLRGSGRTPVFDRRTFPVSRNTFDL